MVGSTRCRAYSGRRKPDVYLGFICDAVLHMRLYPLAL